MKKVFLIVILATCVGGASAMDQGDVVAHPLPWVFDANGSRDANGLPLPEGNIQFGVPDPNIVARVAVASRYRKRIRPGK